MAKIEARVEQGAVAPNTLRVYRSVWDNHIAAAVGELRVRDATVGRLDDFLMALRAHRSASVTQTARTLSGVLGHAVRDGALAQNPIRDVSRIPGGSEKEPRALTPQERERWLEALSEDYIALRHDVLDLTRFLLSAGVRIGVRVDHGVTRVTGHGLVRGKTKTRAGERTLALTPWTLQMLEDRLRMLGEGPIFPSTEGTWRDPSNTGRVFREARKRAGFDWLTTHSFRKTAATVMDQGGLTAREIADHIGHSRISMTQDVYMGRRVASDRAVSALAAAEVREQRQGKV
ncbi:tyrosine-type recombinase/integrase [Pseudonocardia sp. NPDC046786]|uniref:tyrosine-type recombinase/integrase n=1 Tax=Pseudonocardia sp. NPDC046786 TaxID=3155471 RepID=UPI0033D25454